MDAAAVMAGDDERGMGKITILHRAAWSAIGALHNDCVGGQQFALFIARRLRITDKTARHHRQLAERQIQRGAHIAVLFDLTGPSIRTGDLAQPYTLAEGDIVADGSTLDVLLSSPAFAPQVAKVMSPKPWLTVSDVMQALEKQP